ncbi:MAG: hypothetical protein L3J29_13210 [Cyclobacteriaceae bacterium]|nr:hypothetical protein [Cyclobacteriaceae bacterium]
MEPTGQTTQAGQRQATATVAEMATWFGVTVTNGDVTQVILPNNNLNGILPESLGDLLELTQLKLNSNQIGGSIPVSIGSLQKLIVLLLYNNLLTGNIPVELGNLINLVSLQLHDNVFTGTIPASIGNCTKLKFFYIRNANMSGSIPSSFENLTKLQVLFISNCGIDGNLPNYLGDFPNLNNIHLFGNKFTGSIPENWQNLNNLQQLVLHNNQLSGELPLWLKNKSTITALYLGNNTFTGSLTDFIGAWPNLSTLHLTGLGLAGPIPESIGNLTSLQILYLNSNNFTSSPDFTAHPNASNLRVYVQNNNLPIGDIEKNLIGSDMHPFTTFTYGGQMNIAEIDTIVNMSMGGEFAIVNKQAGGVYTNYQWQEWDIVSSLWVDINQETNENYSFIPIVEDHGKKFRCRMTNDWIGGEVFYSDLVTIQIFSGIYYAIGNGNWKDVNVWSTSSGGNPVNKYPRDNDTAIIEGFQVKITDEIICEEINIENTGKLEISGSDASLIVNGQINLTAPLSPAIKMLIVTNGGKIEVK